MNKKNKIFAGIYTITKQMRFAFFVICLCAVSGNVYAADNGCMDEDNDRITPELALCSTHVFNIGDVSNPANDNDKQLMRDVVALKTTVMTQQMKKQYDYLEATIRRFKTQLEKAILTTKLQAAGATDDNSGGGASASRDKNVVLIGAENCMLKSSTSAGLTCIQSNIRIVLQAVSAGNVGEAYRQLQKDLGFANSYGVKCGGNQCDTYEKCKDLRANREKVNDCAYQLNIAVMQKIEEASRQQQNNRQNGNNMFQ